MKVEYPKPGDKVLWIRFGAFGDVLQAAAGAQKFKAKYQDTRLIFLTRPEYVDILKNQPYIDDVLVWNVKKDFLQFFYLIKKLRATNFEWLFSMHRGVASAMSAILSKIPRRFGYNSVMQFCYSSTHWEYLDALGVDFTKRDVPAIFTTVQDREAAAKILQKLPEKKLFTIIGASKPQKFWPVNNWIDFLSPLISDGWGIILNGHGNAEAQTAKIIENALGKISVANSVINLVGQAKFPLMAAIAANSTAAAGNDSGPLHLAALTGTPTLGFFGVTDSYNMNFRMSWFKEVKVTCPKAGCRNYKCPVDCLADITPEKALVAFKNFLKI